MEKKEQLAIKQTQSADGSHAVSAEYSGTLPHPSVVGQFEKIIPGSARDILDMAMKEQDNRHKNDESERDIKRANSRRETLGQITSFAIVVFALWTTARLIELGKSVEGLILILGPLTALVGLFYAYRRTATSEKENKN